MKTQTIVTAIRIPDARLDSWPLPVEAIVEGRPNAQGLVLWKSQDVRLVSGIWACSPGSFRWNWTYDETVVVIEGRATVTTADGRSIDLEPGSLAYFERGTESVWTIHEPFRKGFHALSPDPLTF